MAAYTLGQDIGIMDIMDEVLPLPYTVEGIRG
jgi:hypothetical protein